MDRRRKLRLPITAGLVAGLVVAAIYRYSIGPSGVRSEGELSKIWEQEGGQEKILREIEEAHAKVKSLRMNYRVRHAFEHRIDEATVGPGNDYSAARLLEVRPWERREFTTEIKAEWAHEGEKWYIDYREVYHRATKRQPRHERIAFDGEVTSAWDSVANQGNIQEEDSLPRMILSTRINPLMFVGDDTLAAGLRKGMLQVEGRELIGDVQCLRLGMVPNPEFENARYAGFTWWVDPKRGYAIIQKEDWFHDPGEEPKRHRLYRVKQLKEADKGIWVPISAEKVEYWRSGPDAGKVMSRYEFKAEAGSIRVNRRLGESTFTIDFPLGTQVYDHTTKTKKQSPQKNPRPIS